MCALRGKDKPGRAQQSLYPQALYVRPIKLLKINCFSQCIQRPGEKCGLYVRPIKLRKSGERPLRGRNVSSDPVKNAGYPPPGRAPHLRPLPSTGITRLLQYYEPLRHPAGPASPSRGPGSVRASPPTGLPMLLPSSPSMRASVTTPAGPKRCPRRSLPPPSSAFPISQVGRPPHCPFRGLLDVHSRSGPHVR